MSRIVVTGAAGFIGSHVAEALLRRGDEVVGIDSFDAFYDPAIKRANLATAARAPGFTLREGDIRDLDFVRDVFKTGFDAVIHLAARAGVRPSIEDPLTYQAVNVTGTQILLEVARRAGSASSFSPAVPASMATMKRCPSPKRTTWISPSRPTPRPKNPVSCSPMPMPICSD